jgi:serine/threonine protein kinase
VKLGRFKILKKLGEGGMGSVYLAKDHTLERQVALKVMTQGLTEGREAEQRFLREGRVMGGIRHPGLVQVYDVLREAERLIMVMEYVRGEDLEAKLRRLGTFSLEPTRALLRQLAPALDVLHAKGILHRDIKPANIMLRAERGEALLMDLGLAREEGGTLMTKTGSLLGTPIFMPPEVLLGRGWSAAGDRFQLAAVLYQVLCGKNHVSGENMAVLFKNIAAASWNPFPASSELSEPMKTFLLEALSEDPGKRPASGQELMERFEEAAEGHRVIPEVVLREERGRSRKLLLLVGLASVLAILVLFLQTRGRPQELRWSVVGDQVELRFRAPEGNLAHLEIRGEVGGELRRVGGEDSWVLTYRGLPEGQEEKVTLLWKGEPRETFWAQGASLALALPDHPLAPGPSLRVELHRSCLIRWGGREQLLDVGPHNLRILPGIQLPEQLFWSEEGIPFSLELTWRNLFEKEMKALFEELGEIDVNRALQDSAPRVPGSPIGGFQGSDYEEPRAILRGIRDWIPVLLDSPELNLAPRQRLFHLWQTWSRSVSQAIIQGMDVDPLLLPSRLPGALIQGLPNWSPQEDIPLSVRQKSGLRKDGLLCLDNYLDGSLVATKRRRSTKIIDMHWPKRTPEAGEWVCISLWIKSLEQWSQLELFQPDGDFRAFFWQIHPRPFAADNQLRGWISLTLPVALAPTPGSPLELRARSLLSPQMQHCKIREARVSWLTPGTAGINP